MWDQLVPVERHRSANLMIGRIDLVYPAEVQGIKDKWRALGRDKLIGECAAREIGAELLEIKAERTARWQPSRPAIRGFLRRLHSRLCAAFG